MVSKMFAFALAMVSCLCLLQPCATGFFSAPLRAAALCQGLLCCADVCCAVLTCAVPCCSPLADQDGQCLFDWQAGGAAA